MELLLYGICTIHNNVTFELSRALDTGIFEVRLYEYDLPVLVMSCSGLLVGAIYRLLKFHKIGRK